MPPFDLDSSPPTKLAPLPRVIAATPEQFAAYDARARELGYRDTMFWMLAVLDSAAMPAANDDDNDDDEPAITEAEPASPAPLPARSRSTSCGERHAVSASGAKS